MNWSLLLRLLRLTSTSATSGLGMTPSQQELQIVHLVNEESRKPVCSLTLINNQRQRSSFHWQPVGFQQKLHDVDSSDTVTVCRGIRITGIVGLKLRHVLGSNHVRFLSSRSFKSTAATLRPAWSIGGECWDLISCKYVPTTSLRFDDANRPETVGIAK